MNIRSENGMANLTNIWKASKEGRGKSTPNWRICVGKNFVENIAKREGVDVSEVWKSKKGTNGYTLATWEIAFAYAKWISLELYWQVVKEWCEVHNRDSAAIAMMFDQLSALTEAGKDLMILSGVKG